MKDFNQFLTLFKQELSEFNQIDNHEQLEKFHSFLRNYAQIAEIAYGDDFNNFLMSRNQCPIILKEIKNKIQPVVTQYDIKVTTKGILLNKGTKSKEFPLMDLKSFILRYIHPTEDFIFYLILAWLLEESRFLTLQIFSVIMRMKIKV